jgi:hypothetical protein
MANNWGTPIAVIQLSKAQELHINANAEMNGKFFLVLAKFVKSQVTRDLKRMEQP